MAAPGTHFFPGDGTILNSAQPLLIYRAARAADSAAIERVFAAQASPPAWHDGVFPWQYSNPHAREALGVACGSARVIFGGPNGAEIALAAGDVAVVPTGVGHCGMFASSDLVIVGAYPASTRYTTAIRSVAISTVALPAADPVLGTDGPLRTLRPAAYGSATCFLEKTPPYRARRHLAGNSHAGLPPRLSGSGGNRPNPAEAQPD
ncbi:MAG: cupin [Acetobacteraceae bacterium]|nr:cupin [Acetobacteraceae bacterium]MSP28894.1 cupin [Acetobacteraceae bacterium]